jgi:MFS family permease
MILLPLYFLVVRGLDPVATGLLLVPQGFGVAISMGVSGRLVDRIGGGVVSTVGVAVHALATVPLAFVTGHTSYLLTSLVLVGRGLGMGAAMMPATAAAFAVLRPAQVHEASPQLNVLQRVGGSVGTAILAVVLDDRLAAATRAAGGHPTRDALARAFGFTYWCTIAMTVVGVLPTVFLAVAERRSRRLGGTVEPLALADRAIGD